MRKNTPRPRQSQRILGASAAGLIVCSVYLLIHQEPPDKTTLTPALENVDVKGASLYEKAPSLADKSQASLADKSHGEYLSSVHHASDPLVDDEVEPHPITEQRIVAARHHALFEEISQSLKNKDFTLARTLIKKHESELGNEDGWEAQRRGYAQLLDCLEAPSAYEKERASLYVKRERLSPLRRHIRRVCLEGRDFR